MASGGVLGKEHVDVLLARVGHREIRQNWSEEIVEDVTLSWHLDAEDIVEFAERYRQRFGSELERMLGGSIAGGASADLSGARCSAEASDALLGAVRTRALPGVANQLKHSMGVSAGRGRCHTQIAPVEDIMRIRDLIIDHAGFTPSEHKRIRSTFARYDQDKDGVLSGKETRLALTWLGASPDFARAATQHLGEPARVKEGDYIVIIKQFFQHEEKRVKEALAKADVNRNGAIERSELSVFFEQLGHIAASPEVLEEAVETCGLSERSALDLEEIYQVFIRYREQSGFLRAELDEIVDAFGEFDKDGSGSMDAAELEWVIQWLGYPTTFQMLREVLQEFDIDESGEVELDEFAGFVARYRDNHLREIKRVFIKYAAPATDDGVSTTGAGLALSSIHSALLELGYMVAKAQIETAIESLKEPVLLWDFVTVVTSLRRTVRDRTRKNMCFSDAEVRQLQTQFNAHVPGGAKDPEDAIANSSLAALIEELYPGIRQRADLHVRARKLLEASDANADGKIDFQEFLTMMRLFRYEIRLQQLEKEKQAAAQTSFSPQEVLELRRVFEMFDQDASGDIDLDELGTMLEGVVPRAVLRDRTLLESLRRLSDDGSRALSFADFLLFMREVLNRQPQGNGGGT